jgi:hypothetical protein
MLTKASLIIIIIRSRFRTLPPGPRAMLLGNVLADLDVPRAVREVYAKRLGVDL